MRVSKWLRMIGIFFAVTWVAHTITNYFVVDPEAGKFLSHKDVVDFNQAFWLVVLKGHIVTACLALLVGPIGFSKRILQQRRKVHRVVGIVYVLSVLFSVLAACFLLPHVTGGSVGLVGFICLNAIWGLSTYNAYRKIRARDIAGHRAWMIRSYVLTFANTTLHLLLALLSSVFGIDYAIAYQISIWACLIINYLVADLIVLRTRKQAVSGISSARS